MLEIENHSPFPHFLFEKHGYRGQPFDVLVVRATCRLKTDGRRADLEEKQRPVITGDTYWDTPENSSLKFETDLVLSKKRADIHLIGTARTFEEKPLAAWPAGIRVGELLKAVHLTGPRYWGRGLIDLRLTAPQPTHAVALRYELAFGGQFQKGEQIDAFPSNPVGVGYYPHWKLSPFETPLAPQIESFDIGKRIDSIHKTYEPEGFGPLSCWWEPRVKHTGTYDEAWQKNIWPNLPDDFDFAFYNSARPDMQYPGYLEGNEEIVLSGLLPEAPAVYTSLPGYRLACVAEDRNNTPYVLSPNLDTLTIDLDERLIYLTWRLTLPKNLGMRHIVLGAIVPPPERKGVRHG